jgi:hypothetical protein
VRRQIRFTNGLTESMSTKSVAALKLFDLLSRLTVALHVNLDKMPELKRETFTA